MTTYRVTRFCCTSGMCLTCRAFLVPGKQRTRVVQGSGLTKERAEQYVKGWREYGPKMEPEEDDNE